MLNPNKPPKITGLFNIDATTVGYFERNGKLIEQTIDNPMTGTFQSMFDQNGIYITTNRVPIIPDSKKSYGIWKQKFNEKLKFTGWQVIYVTAGSNNTIFMLEPTKVKHNKVYSFIVSQFNSGFNNNPPNTSQTSFVCQYIGTKAKKSTKSKK